MNGAKVRLLSVSCGVFSLRDTLEAGQTFCWREGGDGWWSGWVDGKAVDVRQKGEGRDSFLEVRSEVEVFEEDVVHYFCLDLDLDEIFATFPEDEWLGRAKNEVRGLRPVREEWWECVGNFICSSQKQVKQIQAINEALRMNVGSGGMYPRARDVMEYGEKGLRECKLGYRARHLVVAAEQVAQEVFSWKEVVEAESLEDAETRLCELRGVGKKVANCILLYAGSYWDAFPVDVWVERLMEEFYGKELRKRRRRKSWKGVREKMKWDVFSREYFGCYRGIAQLYLFHWYRVKRNRGKD